MTRVKSVFSAAVAASLMMTSIVTIAEPLTLKLAHVYPANHYHWTQGLEPFTTAIQGRTGGTVEFEVYPSGQLGKDQIALLEYGVADIGLLIPSLQTDKLPLMSVSELPGMYSTSCEATSKLWGSVQEGDILREEELDKLGVKPLYPIILHPYPVVTKDRKVTSVEDLSGLKLRANGAAIGETFRQLNAVPVQVGATDLYNAATRGTVDGAYFPYTALPSYSLEKVFKYALDGLQLGAGAAMLAISDEAWNKLPKETQEIVMEEANKIRKSYCEWIDEDHERMRDVMVDEHGMEVTFASDELNEQINEKVSVVAERWVERMESIGKPGKAVLKAFENAEASE